ncbi:hypothetical protein ApDm4_2006 [Acetobacter pomorum]|nr:hypothetical protein ApDm4_2006 [Acetobacter pomorum]
MSFHCAREQYLKREKSCAHSSSLDLDQIPDISAPYATILCHFNHSAF